MPGKSKHYQDVHFWILSVIKSCNSIYQLKVVESLIDKMTDDSELNCILFVFI